MSGLNNEILKISKNVRGANLELFKSIFYDSYIKSIVHKNRISKEKMNNTSKILLEQSDANESLITQFSNEGENYYTLLTTLTSLIYYKNYIKHDTKKFFYPYGQFQGEVLSRTAFLIEKVGQLLTNGKKTSGIYVIQLSVNWEKAFKDTRLSNASFIEITYQNCKKIYEINNKEGKFIEIVLPSFSKSDDNVDVSLVYVKEKFNDTIRKNVPAEGIGTLASFTYPLTTDNKKAAAKSKSKSSNIMFNNDDFIVEFKRGDTSLSNKCGTVILNFKFYEFENDGVPEPLDNNIYLSKSDSGGYSDNFQMKEFLDFLITNLVNQWILTITKPGSTSMSIYPPQEAYIGLIEFSMKYSIPASTIYLQISKKLLSAWCYLESYLNAFTAMFITSHVCLMNNKKRFNNMYTNKDEEEMYNYIYDFLDKNVPSFLIQHLSKAGIYQNHGLTPLFMLLSFIIPEDKIDSYVDELVQYSHKNVIYSILSNLKPTILKSKEKNSEKMTQEVSHLLDFINKYKNSSFDKLMDNEIDLAKNEPSKITFSISSLSETLEVLEESHIEVVQQYLDNLQGKNNKTKKKKDKNKSHDSDDNDSNNSNDKSQTKITTRSIFVIINNFMNLKLMWNGFLTHVKKMFPSFFPEEDGKNKRISLPSAGNSSSLLNSSNIINLPPNIMDPVPKLTGITNSIPSLFSLNTSHLVTDTVSPHLWIKNSAMKQIFVKNASKYILNPEFFKTCSPIYASIFDTILNYIKDRINDINATTCMKYYKTMIISFLFGLDSGMMNLLIMHKKKGGPIKNNRLIPILNFIQDIYKEVYQYVNETSLENVFSDDEKVENYTPHSVFMFEHVQDDPEKLIDLISENCSKEIIDSSNEQDPQFLNALCIYIIVSSQTKDKRPKVINWIEENKPHFKKKRFYPPKYK